MLCKSSSAFRCPLSLHLKKKKEILKKTTFLMLHEISCLLPLLTFWLFLLHMQQSPGGHILIGVYLLETLLHFLSGFKVVTRLSSANDFPIFTHSSVSRLLPLPFSSSPTKGQTSRCLRTHSQALRAHKRIEYTHISFSPNLVRSCPVALFCGAPSAFCDSLLALS